jgi:hypothetical protein
MSWQSACEALWGEDWIAPLSEVLAVNRRTVERWKSGEIAIPSHIASELIKIPRIGSAQRAYGDVLRRLARGETMDDVDQSIADQKRAAARARADIGKFSAIAVLAAGRNV